MHGAPFPSRPPDDLSKFVYGTTRLGDASLPVAQRVQMARLAMQSGVWFHTSEQYGDALQVLGQAFSEDLAHVPKLIVKLGTDSIDELRACALRNMRPLHVDCIDLGQLCLSGPLAAEFRDGGRCYDGLRQLREEGLVKRFVVEVFPWTSVAPLEALRAGHADAAIDGVIFYFNPLQRFVTNSLWALLRERAVPVLALRTVAGGHVKRLRDVPGAAWKPYLQKRAAEVAPIFERSGIESWAEFCIRFAFSFSEVRATIGATSDPARFEEFVKLCQSPIEPLDEGIVHDIARLQSRWSDDTDVHAEPWTM